MNTKTTTARKIIVDGKKYSVPETFPSPADLATLASIPHESAQQLAKIAKNILAAGLSFRETEQVWCEAERAFGDVTELSWQEAITSYQEMQQDQPEQEAYPACLPPASSSEVEQLERIYETSPRFRPVSREAYSQLFKGACISRRGGVKWQVWGERILGSMNEANRKEYRGLVALIAFRAYSTPSEQVKGF
jgi:hypothetical protein